MTHHVLLARLQAISEATVRLAGPRYSPAFSPNAPNLPIDPIRQIASATCMDSLFWDRLGQLTDLLRKTYAKDADLLDSLTAHDANSIKVLANELEAVTDLDLDLVPNAMARAHQLFTDAESAIADAERDCRLRLRQLPEDVLPQSGSGTASPRQRLEGRLRALQRVSDALYPVAEFIKGPEGRAVQEKPPILLLGEWGTGKTHFVCDFALHALREDVAAVAVLANTLDAPEGALDAIAKRTGLYATATELLDALEEHAVRVGRRSMVLIDALNEGDRPLWRERLRELFAQIATRPHVSLLLTCRTPFDREVVSPEAQEEALTLFHPGFNNQEFDAQLEFFSFYDLPPLEVPLLASEFSRPLFLKLMCEGLTKLSRRTQKRQLAGVASGQKGMTYILENFVKHVGGEVERRHSLPPLSTWRLLKGEPKRGHAGFAGILALKQEDWLTADEAQREIELQLSIPPSDSAQIIPDMIAAGLLVEHPHYAADKYSTVLSLPYQRFSDHLVARHLLEIGLNTQSELHVRRSFHSNTKLGSVFTANRWGHGWAEPGIASALMVEFPERVRQLSISHTLPSELAAYIPRARLLLHPLSEAFADGLTWRSASSFTSDTERLVRALLEQSDAQVRAELLEALLGLAARPQHPWDARWLWQYLRPLPMIERDLSWSEFIRTSEETSNLSRTLTWLERAPAARLKPDSALNFAYLALLFTTTTDRGIRDRATRVLVRIGVAHWPSLLEVAKDALTFKDPYVPERALAAVYGVCMRLLGRIDLSNEFVDRLDRFAHFLTAELLAPGASHGTWHALTRSYAEGITDSLRLLRPRAMSRATVRIIDRQPNPEDYPFRPAELIADVDTIDGEAAIHMDFGNYTIGRLVDDRGNYDMDHPEYVTVRRQIADYIRMLGYQRDQFAVVDRNIAQYSSAQHGSPKVDRYGKKYSWIAYFEMYGLRSKQGLLSDYRRHEPRSSDTDIDPSFPSEVSVWSPPLDNVFADSPLDHANWLTDGGEPAIDALLSMDVVDGIPGPWILLDSSISVGVSDGREIRAGVTTAMVPRSAARSAQAEFDRGRGVAWRDLPEPGTDFYTFHGEAPWSERFGSDVRRTDGTPKLLTDAAFSYYSEGRWRKGIRSEPTTRYLRWESYHSDLNQVGTIAFPSPPLATHARLRAVDGGSDLVDADGRVSTIFRRAPGPGFGSFYFFVRRDIIKAYVAAHDRALLVAIRGERTLHVNLFEHSISPELQKIFQSGVNDFGEAFVARYVD